MAKIILFKCRACDGEILFTPAAVDAVTCPHCKQSVPVRPNASILKEGLVKQCVSCGHDNLYVQKDFNRNVGVVIVAVGVLIALVFFQRSEPVYAMISLVATAGVDLLIYSLVGEVAVCYACHAVYRGFKRNPEHETFELKNLEKYGGRDPRF